jgi:hypothetical protein
MTHNHTNFHTHALTYTHLKWNNIRRTTIYTGQDTQSYKLSYTCSMCMIVCMIVCLVLYILSYVIRYFIICVCKWEHVYESLYDCVSCPVYIVVRLMLFHYRCVSVRACVWKFVWLCVVLYILSYVLCYWIICACQWEHVYESLYDCVSCPVYIFVRLKFNNIRRTTIYRGQHTIIQTFIHML